MRIPQTAERIKEAPAQALRAVFAGVGQVLLIGERVRRRGGSDGAEATPETAEATPEAEVKSSEAEVKSSEAEVKTAPAKPSTPKASTSKASAPPAPKTPAKATDAKAEAAAPKPAKTATPKATKTTPAKTTPAKTATTATPAEAPAADGAASALPLPNYSELSIASLRARMRGLDVGQVRELLTYERGHEGRENVIAMFERRIAKLEEDGDSGSAKG